MGKPLFDRRTAAEWAAAGQAIEFVEDLGRFERLTAALSDMLSTLDADEMPADWRSRPIRGRIDFGFAGQRDDLPKVTGSAATDAPLVCQRCLKPLDLPLTADFELLLAKQADESEEGAAGEVWELEDGTLRPSELIDELLVMALPFAPRHDNGDCRPVEEPAGKPAENVRPFADLRRQMEKDKQGEH